MSSLCRHGNSRRRGQHCGLCNAHDAGMLTAQLRGEPDAAQRAALDSDPNHERAAEWWCGFREGKEPVVTDELGRRVVTHEHSASVVGGGQP
jgi:hypothetical protein